MRRILCVLMLLAASGCKTVEVAVDYPLPLASVHVVAKFEARDPKRDASDTSVSKESIAANTL